MRVLSFLILSSFVPHLVFGYTVVLKSGKFIEGEFLGDDRFTIQIKDPSGILLSVKKYSVDLKATKLKNSNLLKVRMEPGKTVPSSVELVSRSIVEIAAENRKKRMGGKAYKKEDLAGLPELSMIGSEDVPSSDLLEIGESIELPSKPELYWRKEGMALRKRLESLREKLAGVEDACNQARQTDAIRRSKPHKKVVDLLSMMDEPSACKKQEGLIRELEETQNRWDDFEIRARRAGVPWSWLE